jgi:hypothetical protein
MNTTEQTEQRQESRTETMLDGTLIQYVTISPTGIRIFRKGGGSIDIRSEDSRRNLIVTFNTKE